MPNHCTNRVTVEGDDHIIEWMKAAVYEVDGHSKDNPNCPVLLSAQKIIPMPKELSGTTSPTPDGEAEKAKKLIAKYGHNHWYDWATANWGTKWGNYDFCDGEWDGEAVHFLTAWAPSLPVTKALSAMYPTLIFTHDYCDEGNGFAGSVGFEGGEEVVKTEYTPDTEEWKQFMADLNGDGWLIDYEISQKVNAKDEEEIEAFQMGAHYLQKKKKKI